MPKQPEKELDKVKKENKPTGKIVDTGRPPTRRAQIDQKGNCYDPARLPKRTTLVGGHQE